MSGFINLIEVKNTLLAKINIGIEFAKTCPNLIF